MARAHNERRPDCKKSIRDLLSALYGGVEVNYEPGPACVAIRLQRDGFV
jgi:hypothetical protein